MGVTDGEGAQATCPVTNIVACLEDHPAPFKGAAEWSENLMKLHSRSYAQQVIHNRKKI